MHGEVLERPWRKDEITFMFLLIDFILNFHNLRQGLFFMLHRLSLTLQSSWLSLPNARITGIHDQAKLWVTFYLCI